MRKISGIVLGHHVENEALEKTCLVFHLWHRLLGSIGCEAFSAAPILIFVFLGGAPGFCNKKGFLFEFAETTENVVPKWQGQRRSFCTEGSEMGYSRSGSKMVPTYFSSHCTSFPIHLHVHKENCLISLAFSLLEDRSLSIKFNDCFLLCNKYLLFSWLCSIYLFLLVVFVAFLVLLLLIIIHHSLFWCLFFFSPWSFVVFLLSRVTCLLSFVIVIFLLLLIFLLLFFLFLITSYSYYCSWFVFSFFACILFDCSCCCVISAYSSSFLSCFFFSPGPPRARTWKGKLWKKTSISFFASEGSLRRCPVKKSLFLLFVCGFRLSTKHVLFDVLEICFEGVRDYLLLFVCCYFVALLFEKTIFRSNLSLVPGLFGLVVFSLFVLFLFFVFVRVRCFLASALFLWNALPGQSLPHLGIVFSSLLCPHAASSTSCLGCSFVRVGFCTGVLCEPSWGSFGHGYEAGTNVFFAFSHHWGVWVKTGAALEGAFFLSTVSLLRSSTSSGSTKATVFNCWPQNATK